MSSQEIFALRKQGRSSEALELARAEYPKNTGDIWFLRAYAWLLYDQAKKVVEAYAQKGLSPGALSAQLTPCMREFAKIASPLRKDSAFSQMLSLAGKASKDWPDFLNFARWAGLEDFADEDKVPFVNEKKKTVDSLQKRFTRAICREAALKAVDPQFDLALIEWGLGVLNQALIDDSGDQWLNYYQSKVHLAQGQQDLAVKRLVPVLRRQSRASWPWALLGEILEDARPGDALTCYIHAAQLAREEQEVAKVRIRLAHRLALDGRFDEAALQAGLALEYREQHGFKVPQELAHLIASDWYREVEARGSQRHLPDAKADARSLLNDLDRSSLLYVKGVVDHINHEKALTYVATSIDAGLALSHRRFPEVATLSPGTVVEVGRASSESPPATWRLSDTQLLPGLCETFSGSIERQAGNDFAFIRIASGDIYVPPALARSFGHGQRFEVSCLAIQRTNKQGKTGWRAVRLLEQRQVTSPDSDEEAID